MATHCSILAWEIPWTEEPGGGPWDSPRVCKESDMIECTHITLQTSTCWVTLCKASDLSDPASFG